MRGIEIFIIFDFLIKLIQKALFPIREIQKDNGTEQTKALISKNIGKTLFESKLKDCGIIYHRIKIVTPRHSGKVKRQHRTDELRFYRKMKMYNLQDDREQLAKYNQWSNNISQICLNFTTSNG